MTSTRKKYGDKESLPPEAVDALLRWTLSLADTKHRIGIQLSHWVTGTPALEAAVSAAAITQDELGHARALFSLLRTFPDAPEGMGAENDLQARQIYYSPNALEPRWESWLQVVAINVVLDRALHLAIDSFQESSYAPLASCAGKIMQEERFHRIFGDTWLTRLGQKKATQAQLQTQINWAFGITDEWIGPNDDPVSAVLQEVAILRSSRAELRASWLGELDPLLAAAGLARPTCRTEWNMWRPAYRDSAL